MLSFSTLAALSAIAVTKVAAHGGVLEYSWDNDWYFGWSPYNRFLSMVMCMTCLDLT